MDDSMKVLYAVNSVLILFIFIKAMRLLDKISNQSQQMQQRSQALPESKPTEGEKGIINAIIQLKEAVSRIAASLAEVYRNGIELKKKYHRD